jgi:hypothetical protein
MGEHHRLQPELQAALGAELTGTSKRLRLARARAQECQVRSVIPECHHRLGPQHTRFGVGALVITTLAWVSDSEPAFVCDGRVVPR